MIRHDDDTIKAILDTAARFADRELREDAHGHDAYPYSDFAASAAAGAAEAGLTMITAPESMGGIELPAEVWALVLEKVADSDAGFATVMLAHAIAAEAVIRHGSDALKSQWFGDGNKLLAYPLYLQADDPQGTPAAEEAQDGYVITGAARLVANAPVADAAVIAADLADGPALFAVDLAETKPAPAEMLGLRSCPVGHVVFEDVKVPAERLLAKGTDAIAKLHALFLPSAAAISIATLKASLDYAMEYGAERFQGGTTIDKHTQLRSMYGMMAIEHRTLHDAFLRVVENGSDLESRTALKIMAADLSIRAAMDGVQLLGGYGYTMEYPQERRLRDARQAAELFGSPQRLRLALIDGMIGSA